MDSETRLLVRQRAKDCCEYCGIHQRFEILKHHIEHIIPKQHQGTDHLDNLALACFYCNCHKGTNLAAIDPVMKTIQVLFHPRLQTWNEHFRLEAGRVTGLSAVGRATVQLLRMNDEVRVNIRFGSSE